MFRYRRRSDPASLFALAAALIGLALVIEAIVKLLVVVVIAGAVYAAVVIVHRAVSAPAQPLLRSGDSGAAGSLRRFLGQSAAVMRSRYR